MKFLLVDDHHLIREALRGVLAELSRKAIVLEASTRAEASAAIAANPDLNLVLLDLTLPDGDGFSTLHELRQRHPAISVVVLSAIQDRDSVMKALDLGASGFIPKAAPREVMLNALKLVLAGSIYIPPVILERGPDLAPGSWCASLGLTDRQIEVLILMMQGKSNKTISRTLKLAEPTVKNHVTSILRAFQVTNRTEAVVAAQRLRSDGPISAGH